MNARPQAWLRQASNDLDLARLARDNRFHAQACYFASQAAEKALKGALLEVGLEPPHTHVLNDLVEALAGQGLEVGLLTRLPLKALTRMTITSHYPIDATPPADLFDRADRVQCRRPG
jgi:HEPN domain-containing protein